MSDTERPSDAASAASQPQARQDVVADAPPAPSRPALVAHPVIVLRVPTVEPGSASQFDAVRALAGLSGTPGAIAGLPQGARLAMTGAPAPAPPAPPPPPPKLSFQGVPCDLRVGEIESGRATLEWTPATPVEAFQGQDGIRYEWRYRLELQEGANLGRTRNGKVDRPDGRWRDPYAGPETEFVAADLLPGRVYKARVGLVAESSGSSNLVIDAGRTSDELSFETLPALPVAPHAPGLTIRARNTLKLKWADPDEPGGRPVHRFELIMRPLPEASKESSVQDAEGFALVYAGEERFAQVKKLRPACKYTFQLRAFTAVGASPWSSPISHRTQATVPAAPEAPRLTQVSPGSLELAWSEPASDGGSPIEEYELFRRDLDTPDFELVYRGLEPRCAVDGLPSGSVHEFRARARNLEGLSHFSDVLRAETATRVPGGCEELRVSRRWDTGAEVAWAPPQDTGGCAVARYEVEIAARAPDALADLPRSFRPAYVGPEPRCELGGLRAGRSYALRVRASHAAGPGPWSGALAVRTSPVPPEATSRPRVAGASDSTLGLVWARPVHDGGQDVTGYVLQHRLQGDGGAWIEHRVGNVLDAALSDLSPGTCYEVRVAAANAQGRSAWSPALEARTEPAPPAPPDALELRAASASSLTLAWAVPDDCGSAVKSHVLRLARQEEPRDEGLATVPPASRFATVAESSVPSCVVDSLDPDEVYWVSVAASNAAGTGAWSEPRAFRTGPAAPAAPSAPEAAPGEDPGTLAVDVAPTPRAYGSATTAYQVEAAAVRGRAAPATVLVEVPGGGEDAQRAHLSAVVAGLVPGAEYDVRARCRNACGWSSWSLDSRARCDPCAPGPPFDLAAGKVVRQTVRLRWLPPLLDGGRAVRGYRVFATDSAGADSEPAAARLVYQGAECECRVTQLAGPGTSELRVMAWNVLGDGPLSSPLAISVPAPAPPPPEGVRCALDAAGTGVVLSWAAPMPGTGAHQCEAEISPVEPIKGGSSVAQRAVCRAEDMEVCLPNLPLAWGGASLRARVRAVGPSGAGCGDWSPPALAVLPRAAGPAEQLEGEEPVFFGGKGRREKKTACAEEGAQAAVARAQKRAAGKQAAAQALKVAGPAARAAPRKPTVLLRAARALGMAEAELRLFFLAACAAALALALAGLVWGV